MPGGCCCGNGLIGNMGFDMSGNMVCGGCGLANGMCGGMAGASGMGGCLGANHLSGMCGGMCPMGACMNGLYGGMCGSMCGGMCPAMYGSMAGGAGGLGCLGCGHALDAASALAACGLGASMGLIGATSSTTVDAEGLHEGVVKSFNEEKGWGHISCSSTHLLYGKDIFLMRSSLRGGRVKIGDRVRFSVQIGAKGPQASDVTSLESDSLWASQDVGGKSFNGKIKQYSDEKGWGFITCDQTHKLFGKDMFVHKREFGGHFLKVGDLVTFSVEFSKDNRPEAKNVVVTKGEGEADRGYGPAKDSNTLPVGRDAPY